MIVKMLQDSPIVELMKLQEDITQLICGLSSKFSGGLMHSGQLWSPNTDLSEDSKEIVVRAEVPGIGVSDLEVVFQEGYLQISGEKKQPNHKDKDIVRYLCLERSYGKFSRIIYLNVAVDINTASAKLHNGVLTIALPKLSNRRKQEKIIPIEHY
jgi:HSP20 family protein